MGLSGQRRLPASNPGRVPVVVRPCGLPGAGAWWAQPARKGRGERGAAPHVEAEPAGCRRWLVEQLSPALSVFEIDWGVFPFYKVLLEIRA